MIDAQALKKHGGGVTSIIKVFVRKNFPLYGMYRRAAEMGYTFQASKYMNGNHFYIKSISMGYLVHPKKNMNG